jgi:hypothetical protein
MVLNETITTGNLIVERISPWSLVMWFVVYLVLHIAIGVMYKKKEKEFIARKDNDTKEYSEAKTEVMFWSIAFKWFPAVYLIVIIAIFAL